MPEVAVSSRQTKEHPSVCLPPPFPLSSPVIKKKAIQIPSFDEKGLVYDKHNTKQTSTDSSRSFIPICSFKTSSQSSWSRSCQHGERASTLPRTKPKTYNSPTVSAKSSTSMCPAPKPNSSPTPSTLTPKPSDSLPASQLTALSLLLPQPKPSVSPTLIVPTPRLSPSPTSLCQGIGSDGQGAKHPSPVAKERRAKSITISNAQSEPKQSFSSESKHDILNQEALLDFTHPALRSSRPMMSGESGRDTYYKSQKQAATKAPPCFLQEKSKNENTSQHKQQSPQMNLDFIAIPKPKSDIKQQLEFLPSGATGKQKSLTEPEGIKSINVVHRESHSMFDELATEPSFSLQRKYSDYPQKRHHAQTAGFASSHQSEHVYAKRSAALPITPKIAFSSEPLCVSQSTASPNIKTRRRQFELNNQKKVDAGFLSASILRGPQEENSSQTGASRNIQSLQKHRVWMEAQSQSAQMDVLSSEAQSGCLSKDYSCKSRDIDQKVAASQCGHRLNRLKTCLVAPQTQEDSRPASVECTTSHTESSQKPEPQSQKYPLDLRQSPGQTKIHKEVKLSDTALNKKDIFAPPDRCVLPAEPLESPSQKSWSPSVARHPFNTNRSGIISKGVLPSEPQHSRYQRPEETTALLQPHYSSADRAFILEEPEDPYYVTMYYPGSVYVGVGTQTRGWSKRIAEGFKMPLLISGVTDTLRREVAALVSRLCQRD
ncbi:hypothetical protein Q5P01_025126 [Channa striata]|uniref:Uncharacterized protein n=1 Tax=Channa striata TaxID=64152 RepID=A0AA88IMS3_CHASR|nr:hypothetical protein Q5P01_025126 [Channa striata]